MGQRTTTAFILNVVILDSDDLGSLETFVSEISLSFGNLHPRDFQETQLWEPWFPMKFYQGFSGILSIPPFSQCFKINRLKSSTWVESRLLTEDMEWAEIVLSSQQYSFVFFSILSECYKHPLLWLLVQTCVRMFLQGRTLCRGCTSSVLLDNAKLFHKLCFHQQWLLHEHTKSCTHTHTIHTFERANLYSHGSHSTHLIRAQTHTCAPRTPTRPAPHWQIHTRTSCTPRLYALGPRTRTQSPST